MTFQRFFETAAAPAGIVWTPVDMTTGTTLDPAPVGAWTTTATSARYTLTGAGARNPFNDNAPAIFFPVTVTKLTDFLIRFRGDVSYSGVEFNAGGLALSSSDVAYVGAGINASFYGFDPVGQMKSASSGLVYVTGLTDVNSVGVEVVGILGGDNGNYGVQATGGNVYDVAGDLVGMVDAAPVWDDATADRLVLYVGVFASTGAAGAGTGWLQLDDLQYVVEERGF